MPQLVEITPVGVQIGLAGADSAAARDGLRREDSERGVPIAVGNRVASQSIGDGVAIVTGLPVGATEVRAISRSISHAARDPASKKLCSKGLLYACILFTLFGIGLIPTVWCLTLYYGWGDEPCDRPIAYCLFWIGWCGVTSTGWNIISSLLMFFCGEKTAQGEPDGEGKCRTRLENAKNVVTFGVHVVSFNYFIQLSGICWWMYPYSEQVVYELEVHRLVPLFNASHTPSFFEGNLWYKENDITLLPRYEGCHPTLLFGARDYLLFMYIWMGVMLICCCCVLPVCICVFVAGKLAVSRE